MSFGPSVGVSFVKVAVAAWAAPASARKNAIADDSPTSLVTDSGFEIGQGNKGVFMRSTEFCVLFDLQNFDRLTTRNEISAAGRPDLIECFAQMSCIGGLLTTTRPSRHAI